MSQQAVEVAKASSSTWAVQIHLLLLVLIILISAYDMYSKSHVIERFFSVELSTL